MKRASLLLLVSLGCGAPAAAIEEAPHRDLDRDHDGIVDAQDTCPCLAEDVDGIEDTDGCPDLDDDHDNISDACDACPSEPETYNGGCDEDGCPDYGHICVEMAEVVILERIQFAERSAQLSGPSHPILDAVAQTLIAHPEIEHVVVHGHATAHEPRAVSLAERRAQAVRTALATRGVDAARLSALGEVSEGSDVRFDITRTEGRDVDASAFTVGCGARASCAETSPCPPPPQPVPNCL